MVAVCVAIAVAATGVLGERGGGLLIRGAALAGFVLWARTVNTSEYVPARPRLGWMQPGALVFFGLAMLFTAVVFAVAYGEIVGFPDE